MKFNEWIRLRELMAPTSPTPKMQTPAKPPSSNPNADLDNIKGIVLNSDPRTAANRIKQYYGNKIKKGTDAAQIAGAARDMNAILDKLSGK